MWEPSGYTTSPCLATAAFISSSTLAIATIFYAFQIYFDFAGYSDIAIGTARLFGFEFKQNFNFPYFAKSLTIFWRRWHKSLSFWLRDYLYISLGGNRKGLIITYRNLMITMLLGGLWHGSSWNFVIWGAIHGIVLGIEKFLNDRELFLKLRSNNIVNGVVTFGVVVFSWIFFRSNTFSQSLDIINTIFSFQNGQLFIGDVNIFTNIIFALVTGLALDFLFYRYNKPLEIVGSQFKNISLLILISIFLIIIVLFYSTSDNFIYFQF